MPKLTIPARSGKLCLAGPMMQLKDPPLHYGNTIDVNELNIQIVPKFGYDM